MAERSKMPKSRRQGGMSILELMIATAVLLVGVLGSMAPIILAIGSNGKNRLQSNSTVIAQMVMEKIMSVPANTSPTLTITDCTGTAQSISTAGGPAPGLGATLTSYGSADFTQPQGSAGDPANYYVLYTNCGTNNRAAIYDVRWNIQTISPFTKLITVSAKLQGTNTDAKIISLPVTIRSLAGQGS